ncbi:hypothetical protein LJR289_004413 [Pseudoduganella sp. LjRoot289]|uniref:hypothetical protein n=1 Tax=Pseudoduganella sp. LjRoot289 TaxID=3342314 RepID=UPI003ECEFB61
MKAIPVRTAAAAALLLALSACGGKASFDVGGVFVNSQGVSQPLANSGLVLKNGSDTLPVAVGSTSFKFNNSISYGTAYEISVQTPPNHMNCTVANGSGSAGHTQTITASVICSQNTYKIGGTVSGITGDTVVTLINGSLGGSVTLNKDSTSYAFAAEVADGQAYGVTVAQVEPAGALKCVVANPSGVMSNAPRTDINVTCSAP